ncbi:hypothetical protein Golax_020722 [Gossypium laxum]|uniref:Uncharacterized protein n=2 Tax=Gossypium TaxID=3633 RepID=A0A7J9K181_9ROSI|nr:hypothetical protein [Gossypium laxum]MBA0840079.1 hypothetical protein [Gossypium armourianum]
MLPVKICLRNILLPLTCTRRLISTVSRFKSSLLKLEGTMLFGFSGALVISQMMTLSHFLREQR